MVSFRRHNFCLLFSLLSSAKPSSKGEENIKKLKCEQRKKVKGRDKMHQTLHQISLNQARSTARTAAYFNVSACVHMVSFNFSYS